MDDGGEKRKEGRGGEGNKVRGEKKVGLIEQVEVLVGG